MKQLRRLIAAALLIAGITPAIAQTFPTVPSQTVIGRTAFGSGPAQAIPFSQITAQICNTFTLTIKGCVPAPGSTTGRYLSDDIAVPWKAVPSQQIVAGTGVTLGGACVGNTLNCTVNSVATTQLIYASRATAATLNLSAFSVIHTLGYATAGDGGGATYKNIGAGIFQDTYITTATVAAGSGYTNGTYKGVPLGGGTGLGCSGKVIVAGGVVTSIAVAIPCAGYSVGDVLTPLNSSVGGTGSGATWTVTAISTPQSSFTDAAGNHFQYVQNGGSANLLQFGCKGDWAGTDAGATNNSPCIWSAMAWAGRPINGSSTAGIGGQVLVPRGAYMTCNNFIGNNFHIIVPQNVRLTGDSIFGATFIECAADSAGFHYFELCDPFAVRGQIGCRIEFLNLYGKQVTGSTAGIAMIHSSSGQQMPLVESVEVNAGNRGCFSYDTGAGGAANAIVDGIDCAQLNTAATAGFVLNSPSTQIAIRNSVCTSSPNGSATCISVVRGRMIVDNLDIEGFVTGLQMANANVGEISVYKNVQQSSNSCTQAVLLQGGGLNAPGNLVLENVATACPVTITNGQAGGANLAGNIVKQIWCNPGAPCN